MRFSSTLTTLLTLAFTFIASTSAMQVARERDAGHHPAQVDGPPPSSTEQGGTGSDPDGKWGGRQPVY